MDLNELKNIWNDFYKDDIHLDKEQIGAMLKIKSKSKTALVKIKKSYKFEFISVAIMYLIILFGLLFFIKTSTVLIFIGLITLIMGLPYYYVWKTYKKIKNTVISSKRLKPTLISTINDIEKYVNFTKSTLAKYIIIPFALLLGMSMGIFISLSFTSGDMNFIETVCTLKAKSIIKMILILVIGSGVMIPLSQYFNKKMYKQHLDELKQCLKEFEETENI